MEAKSSSLLGGDTEIVPIFIPDPDYEAKIYRLIATLLSLEESSAVLPKEAMFDPGRCA